MTTSKLTGTRRAKRASESLDWNSGDCAIGHQDYVSRYVEEGIDRLKLSLTRAFRHHQKRDWKRANEIAKTPVCDTVFAESSQPFALLSRILSDCRERRRLQIGFRLAVEAYELTCLWQVREFRRLLQAEVSPLTAFAASRVHKGHLLFEIVRACEYLEWPWHLRYYLKLTLVEDLMTHFFLRDPKGKKLDEKGWQRFWRVTGCSEVLQTHFGKVIDDVRQLVDYLKQRVFVLTEADGMRLCKLGAAATRNGKGWPVDYAFFPEWLLGRLEQGFLPPAISQSEAACCPLNSVYWAWLSNDLFSPGFPVKAPPTTATLRVCKNFEIDQSLIFEEAARYAVSCVPGITVMLNSKGHGGEIDGIGLVSSEATQLNAMLGSTFLLECKWEENPVETATIDSLVNRVRSSQTNTFVLFSKRQTSGRNLITHANAVIYTARHEGMTAILLTADQLGMGEASDKMAKATCLSHWDEWLCQEEEDSEGCKPWPTNTFRKLDMFSLIFDGAVDSKFSRFR